MKRFLSIFLAFVMVLGIMVPTNIAQAVDTPEPVLEYQLGTAKTIENKEDRILATEDLDLLKSMGAVTISLRFKVTKNEGVQSLFYAGSNAEGKENQYFNLYILPESNKIGLEIRDGSGRDPFNESFGHPTAFNDGEWHNLTFTIDRNVKYWFRIDGKQDGYSRQKTYFLDGVGLGEDFNVASFGGGDRFGDKNDYIFKGEMKDIRVFNQALTPEQQDNSFDLPTIQQLDVVASYDQMSFMNEGQKTQEPASAEELEAIKAADPATIALRFRLKETGQAATLLDMGETSIGVNAEGHPVVRKGEETLVFDQLTVSDKNWQSLIVSANAAKTTVHLGSESQTLMTGLALTKNASHFVVGGKKDGSEALAGAVENLTVYAGTPSADQVLSMRRPTIYEPHMGLDPERVLKTDPVALFPGGYKGSNNYRIPSLITTNKGTVIAAADKRVLHASDWGNIDTMIRRKEAGQEEFGEGFTIIDLADQVGQANSAFLIDAAMVQDRRDNKIYLLVDMFPECQGFFGSETGTGYVEIEGKKYRKLTEVATGKTFTVRDEGVVYDDQGERTDYRVVVKSETMPFHDLGDLYQGEERLGNIYLKTGPDAAPLRAYATAYLWLTTSEDDGKTWSSPVDITPMVKEEWMRFMGTGPGAGLQLENGDLCFPVYFTNRKGKQNTTLIKSSDGVNWHRTNAPNDTATTSAETINGNELTEAQLVQLNNGDVKLFMRNTSGYVKIATSHDNGENWDDDLEQVPWYSHSYCQLSVIKYERDGKEYILLSNPSVYGRKDGTVRRAVVNEDGSLTWDAVQDLAKGHFQYSCLTQIDDDRFGILYELDDPTGHLTLYYTEFNEYWVAGEDVPFPATNPVIENVETEKVDDGYQITVTFNEKMFVTGNPVLELTLGKQKLEAAYQSGSTTKELVFKANIPEDFRGKVKLTAVLPKDGTIESIPNFEVVNPLDLEILDMTAIPKEKLSAQATSECKPPKGTDGPSDWAIDGDESTWWHTSWGQPGDGVLPQAYALTLDSPETIDRLGYLGRGRGLNGGINGYKIYVRDDAVDLTKNTVETEGWTLHHEGNFKDANGWQYAEFEPVEAKQILIVVNSSFGTEPNKFVSAREFKLFYHVDESEEPVVPVDPGEDDDTPIPTDETKEIVVEEMIPFETKEEMNDKLAYGTRNIKVEGVNGKKNVTYRLTYKDGKLVKTEEISSEVVTEPVTQVVEVGTKLEGDVIDKTELGEQIARAEALDAERIPREKFDEFANALAKAKLTLKNWKATADEVKAAKDALERVLDNLELLPLDGFVDGTGHWAGYKFYYEDGEKAKGFRMIDGEKYYFRKSSGTMATGWQYINNYWFYFKENGQAVRNSWLTLDGSTYWFRPSGTRVNYKQYIDGAWRLFTHDGKLTEGFIHLNGFTWYTRYREGYVKGWLQIGDLLYYFRETSGTMVSGWQYIDGGWYWFRSHGTCALGWQYINGSWYYISREHGRYKEPTTIDGKLYQFRADGVCTNK